MDFGSKYPSRENRCTTAASLRANLRQFLACRSRIRSDLAIWIAVLAMFLAVDFLPSGSATGDSTPTFSKDVTPILFKNCINCHRRGEIASRVPLMPYDAARPWAEAIKHEVMTREMPPWPADPDRSVKFRNDARLSQREIDTLVAWVKAGAPKGNEADLPPMPNLDEGWMHPQGRKPDIVLSLPGLVHVPASGELPYARLLVKVPFSDDRWVAASQTRPGNPLLVHHMAITELELGDGVHSPGLDQLAAVVARQMGLSDMGFGARPAVTATDNKVFDMLGMYTPGSTFEMYPEGTAKLLKGGKNVYLNFNMHYKTIGVAGTDRSMIGLWFQPGPPRHQLFRVPGAGETILANGEELLTDAPGTKAEGTNVAIPPIPPGAENYEVTGVTGYRQAVTIYQFQPHAHHHGKDFTYTVVYPDGREQTVLKMPKYDQRWQMAYDLETPLKLPAGSKLVVTAHYDNSMKQTHGMPLREVYFRDQNTSLDEMFSPFIQYSFDRQEPGNSAGVPQERQNKAVAPQPKLAAERVLEIGEVVGCLEETSHGNWLLTHAGEPTLSESQATSSVDLKAADLRPLGSRQHPLLGVSVFKPLSHEGQKVVVKGVLIKDIEETRINVTSLVVGPPSRCAGLSVH
jgi:Copper type II ascorbate-dependent monooxygenase, C-terminal domain